MIEPDQCRHSSTAQRKEPFHSDNGRVHDKTLGVNKGAKSQMHSKETMPHEALAELVAGVSMLMALVKAAIRGICGVSPAGRQEAFWAAKHTILLNGFFLTVSSALPTRKAMWIRGLGRI